ncbi:DUF2190 family protein [Vibrio brasiliensis]|uniref:DUF2190 family protein n=1 Tax=Vibrio brasiliensis TaxID=170652 RepID=UPI001EFD25C6|nr:DUF2190 family protein [Vibrio brasiliensis]MCG9785399.1 DUF2190 family protein [Vibrio brasiliensis]
MKHFSNGDSITLSVATEVKQGKPFLHGKLLLVPSVSAPANKAFTAEYKGAFQPEAGDIKDGVGVTYDGSPAYWSSADNALVTTASGNTKVGYFINHLGDDVVLLTGA